MQLAVERKSPRITSSSGIKIERIVITPDIAAAWLEKNVKNRKLQRHITTKYARDMKTGAWQGNGDAIRFDLDHNLLDGQHRLKACVEADVPFETFVVYGLPPETQDVMDIGKGRGAGDMFTLMGLHNVSTLTAALRILIAERDGVDKPKSYTVSNAKIKAAYQKHPLITRYLPTGGVIPKGIAGGQVGYLRYVGAEFLKEPDVTQSMFEVLRYGVPAYTGDPIHAYRERIIRMGDSKTLSIAKDTRWWTLKAAFNMFRKGETTTHLRFGRDNCAINGLDVSKL